MLAKIQAEKGKRMRLLKTKVRRSAIVRMNSASRTRVEHLERRQHLSLTTLAGFGPILANIGNPSAVKNLMTMGKNTYVHCGAKSNLESVVSIVIIFTNGRAHQGQAVAF